MIEFTLVSLSLGTVLVILVVVWKSNRRLHLVKDLRSGEPLFYWESLEGKVLSPEFESVNLAKHWWVKHEFSDYKGAERRQRFDDRRQDADRRQALDVKVDVFNDAGNQGRRHTDKNVTPDIERR